MVVLRVQWHLLWLVCMLVFTRKRRRLRGYLNPHEIYQFTNLPMPLPEEEASEEEKREIEAARKEIAKGSKVKLDDLVKELC